MKKQVEIKWDESDVSSTEKKKIKECIKVFIDNELIVIQHSLSAVAFAEVLSRLDCDVFISTEGYPRRRYKPHTGHVIQRGA